MPIKTKPEREGFSFRRLHYRVRVKIGDQKSDTDPQDNYAYWTGRTRGSPVLTENYNAELTLHAKYHFRVHWKATEEYPEQYGRKAITIANADGVRVAEPRRRLASHLREPQVTHRGRNIRVVSVNLARERRRWVMTGRPHSRAEPGNPDALTLHLSRQYFPAAGLMCALPGSTHFGSPPLRGLRVAIPLEDTEPGSLASGQP